MLLNKKRINKRNKINLIASALILLIGILLLMFPAVTDIAPVKMIYVVFALYSAIKFAEYILANAKDDKELIYTAIVSLLASISGFKFSSYDAPMTLALTLVSWVGAMCIIKLIKLDFYHDRKNGMLYINLVSFSLFLLIGLLTSINLYFSDNVQYLMLGFFFTVVGILDLAEDAIRILVSNNMIKISDIK